MPGIQPGSGGPSDIIISFGNGIKYEENGVLAREYWRIFHEAYGMWWNVFHIQFMEVITGYPKRESTKHQKYQVYLL